MYTTVFVTVLATLSVLVGISMILPNPKQDTINTQPKNTEIPDKKTDDVSTTEFSESCYDKITKREDDRIYIFQSKQPLQEGTNPKVFSDLATYRVWAEQYLGDGLRCPVLYFDPESEPYIHPEEKFAGKDFSDEVKNVRASTLQKTREMKSSYIHSAMTEPARYISTDGVTDEIPVYAEANGKLTHVHQEDMIEKSQREALGLGADQSLTPVNRNELRDVSTDEISRLVEEMDPSLKGAVLKRTGYSKYEIDEVIPERNNKQHIEGMNIDLLAYGGTVVPVNNINKLFG